MVNADLLRTIPRLEAEEGRKYILLGVLAFGALLVLAAAALTLLSHTYNTSRTWMAAFGLVVLVLSLEASRPVQRLERLMHPGGEPLTPSASLRRWSQLKSASILLALAVALGVGVLALALAVRVGLPIAEGLRQLAPFDVPLSVLLLGLLGILLAAVFLSLRTEYDRRESPVTSAGSIGLVAVATVLALAAAYLAAVGSRTAPGLVPADAPFLLLGATTVAALLVFPARGVPSPLAVLLDERRHYQGHLHLTFGKSVLMPVLVALAVLLPFGFLFVLAQTGVSPLFEAVATNKTGQVLLGSFLTLLVGVVAGAAFLTFREEKVQLYEEHMSKQQKIEVSLLSISAFFTLVFAIVSFMVFLERPVFGAEITKLYWVDFFGLAIISAVGPYGFYTAHHTKRSRRLEARFPDFLRDVASGRKAGLTLEATIIMAARADYGELSPEIRKMADQLSWNLPFTDALTQFAERVRTPLIERAVSVINEASRTGGNVTNVLQAVAKDAAEIKDLEAERHISMMVYTAITYIAFLVYLGVIAVLFHTLVPQVLEVSERAAEQGTAGLAAIKSGVDLADYRTFYYLGALVQAVGNGVMAGLFESGRLMGGLKHAFIMTAVAVIAFVLLGGT